MIRKTCLILCVLLLTVCSAIAQAHTITISPNGLVASLLMDQTEYDSWKANDDYSNSSKRMALIRDIYGKFKDDYDFIFLVLNESSVPSGINYYGQQQPVSNGIKGIGRDNDIFDQSSEYGSAGRLKALVQMTTKDGIKQGPSLHELLHQWANYGITTEGAYDNIHWSDFRPHWGVTGGNTRGQLGGFAQSTLQANVDGNPQKYRVGKFYQWANGGNGVPYSQMELYLMGLIPASDVAPFDVFTGITSYDDSDPNYTTFTATNRKTYTPETIVAELGERYPSYLDSQKRFSLLVVVLTPTPLADADWQLFEDQAKWFSQASDDGNSTIYNFWEATGGRASVAVGNLANHVIGASAVKGDINEDGKIDIFDALLALQYAMNLIPHDAATDAKYLAAADVAPLDTVTMKPKGDGKIDVMDALVILQRAVNLVNW